MPLIRSAKLKATSYIRFKFFTALVSKKSTEAFIEKECANVEVKSLDFIAMKTGRKESRIAVWKF